jgi:hypothetical protein
MTYPIFYNNVTGVKLIPLMPTKVSVIDFQQIKQEPIQITFSG